MNQTSAPPKELICRLCLEPASAYFSLLFNSEAAKMLQAVTALTISADDEISSVICKQCTFHLRVAFDIQQFMLGAEQRFQERQNQNETLNQAVEEITVKEVESEQTETVKKQASVHVCQLCGDVKSSRGALIAHRNSHTPKIKCSICKTVVAQVNFQKHVQRHKIAVCEICGVQCPLTWLRRHIRKVHGNIRYKCQYCETTFGNKVNRAVHESRVHIGEPNFVCETCGKKFFARHLMVKHRKLHNRVEKYVCGICKKNFSSRETLNRHRKKHGVRECVHCQVCDVSFLHKASLMKHLREKHKIEEVKRDECSECGKKFVSKMALYTHFSKAHC